jgi:integrase
MSASGHKQTRVITYARSALPLIPLPRRLLAHLRRWKRLGQTFAVEWNGRAVRDCDKAFRNVAEAAGLPDVTPHIIRHTCATWLAQSGRRPGNRPASSE